MKKMLMALAVLMFAGAFWSQPAEARCWWNGFRTVCTHHYWRHHWLYGYYRPYRHHHWWYAYYRPYRHHHWWYGYYRPYRYYYRPHYYGYYYHPYYYRPWVCVGPLCLG